MLGREHGCISLLTEVDEPASEDGLTWHGLGGHTRLRSPGYRTVGKAGPYRPFSKP